MTAPLIAADNAPRERVPDAQPATALPALTGRAGILAMQRLAGNRAVCAAMCTTAQRQPIPVADTAHSFQAAVAAHLWDAAVDCLHREPEPMVRGQLAALGLRSPADLVHLTRSIPLGDPMRRLADGIVRETPAAQPLAVAMLEGDLRSALGSHEWHFAAVILRGFSHADVQRLLPTLNFAAIDGLNGVVRGADARWFASLAADVGAAFTTALHAAIETQLGLRHYPDALRLADRLRDDELVAVLTRAQAEGHGPGLGAACAAVFPDDAHRVRRMIRYTSHPADFDAAAGPAHSITTTGGTPQPGVNGGPERTPVPGGEAWTTTNEHMSLWGQGPVTDAFGLHYRDTPGAGLAPTTGWLQFVAASMEALDGDGRHIRWSEEVVGAAGTPSTIRMSRPDAPVWALDTASDIAPFYESPTSGGATAASTTGPDVTEIYDRPDDLTEVARSMFGSRVRRVVYRNVFEEYLVRGHDVLFFASMEVTRTLNDPTGSPERTTRQIARDPTVRAIRRDQHDALMRRFRSYAVYPVR